MAENALLIALWRGDRGRLRYWLAVQAALALLYLPWVLAQKSFLSGKASAQFDELTLPGLISIVKRSFVASSVGTTVKMPTSTLRCAQDTAGLSTSLGDYLTLVLLLLLALGLAAAFRSWADGDRWRPWLL